MNVVIFGATGMVGQGVLREALLDDSVRTVVTVGRGPTGKKDPKLRGIVHGNLLDLGPIAGQLGDLDACFFCLGVTSSGMTEADYRRVTHDFAVSAARTLLAKNPGMTFVFVSGAGADGTARSRTMWARVKGEAENAIQKMPFKAAYVFRPAFIEPLHGIRSRTRMYNVLYSLLRPLVPLVRLLFPAYVTTTERVGQAMLEVAKRGAPKAVLENRDINDVAARAETKTATGATA